jgi:hypothetical protein
MGYFVFPMGTPNHETTLEARLDTITAFPYMPPGLAIQWRQNGAIVKTGSTSVFGDLTLNTGATGDFNFDATDSGSSVDFVIDGVDFSAAVVLSNNLPALAGGPQADAYGRVAKLTQFVWTYSDADGDPLYYYRVKVGTFPGGGDIFDSGKVFGDPGINGLFEFDLTSPLTPGVIRNWQICVSDGEKVNPLDPDLTTTDRVESCIQGVMHVNQAPFVHDVRFDGYPSGGTALSLQPVITWQFNEPDAQPQTRYRIIVSGDPTFATQVLWDSSLQDGGLQSITYNFDGTGVNLVPHVMTYVSVTAYDTLDEPGSADANFVVANPPVIQIATVDNRVNPKNLKNTVPTFTWEYADADGDPLVSYEVRVANNSAGLGTDSFIGNIWTSGVIVTPEAHQATFATQPGSCLPCSCCLPTEISPGIVYYFQIQVYDAHGKSEWFTGFFRINVAPTAANLLVLPMNPFNNDDLSATYEFVDDAPEVESDRSEIKWYRNGSEVRGLRNQRVVPKSETTPKDSWYFTVRPHDGVDFGSTYASGVVFIANRPPQATVLGLFPDDPRTEDSLLAVYSTSDPDDDPVTVSLRWFKNGAEQPELRNSTVVPPSFTSIGDEWYFLVAPNDGFDDGPPAQSAVVRIGNSGPRVTSMTVEGEIMPKQVDSPNPVMSWTYFDPDGLAQSAYQVAIGTRPLKTRAPNGIRPSSSVGGSAFDGIFSTANSAGEVIAGNEIFDSGVVNSPDLSFSYSTPDFLPEILFNVVSSKRMSGYEIDTDGKTLALAPAKAKGDVEFKFDGTGGAYEVDLVYVLDEGKRSRFRLVVAGQTVDEFVSQPGKGRAIFTFAATRIEADDVVLIQGFSVDPGAKARFESIVTRPLTEFEVPGGDFNVLSGYVSDDNRVIRLVGLAGTASTKFPFPPGTYDVELVYLTESAGSPSLTLSVNATTIMSFNYETGAKTRRRLVSGVEIGANDVIKINATRNGGASAKVEKVVFKPSADVKVGAKLKDGFTYYASVRVFDSVPAGSEPIWSAWHTTRFTMAGSAWITGVSNSKGWTIEARLSVGKIQGTGAVQDLSVESEA